MDDIYKYVPYVNKHIRTPTRSILLHILVLMGLEMGINILQTAASFSSRSLLSDPSYNYHQQIPVPLPSSLYWPSA